MKYAELGNTGIQVSKICIGAMSFGKASQKFLQWTLNQNETEDMIAH
ncbi:Putative Aldo/keto reductase, partial [Candidatus Arthromitus sp. SFB-3]